MLKLTSPILSDGFRSPSISCPNLSLRGFIEPRSREKSFTAKTRFDTRMPRLQLFAAKPIKPLICTCRAHVSDRKDKVVVIMGATGSGKSRLSVDLATMFSAEIINSDKVQFYNGLEITTNQITVPERCGVPHHLLGELHPDEGELTIAEFRSEAARAISGIVSRGKLPILAGGSYSYVHALLADHWDPENDPFNGSGSICNEFRYDCCFLWVDVSLPVLFEYLSKRVDKMIESGLFEELAGFYSPNNGTGDSETRVGIWKAIGVPEFDTYFKNYPPEENGRTANREEWDAARKAAYEKAVREIKENTFQLAKKQLERIRKMRSAGWDIRRLDATASCRAALAEEGGSGGVNWREIWTKEVVEPCVEIVRNEVIGVGERERSYA